MQYQMFQCMSCMDVDRYTQCLYTQTYLFEYTDYSQIPERLAGMAKEYTAKKGKRCMVVWPSSYY
eukprot:5758195-Amphidinium_carterae.2